MRILWGRANSSNVMKAVWLMEELALPYQRRDAGGPFGGTRTPEYLAMNPNAAVPTLQEDGFILWESNAILRYLCGAHAPGHTMWPADLRARGAIDQWLDWQQTTLGPPQTVVFQGLVRTPLERRDNAAIAAAWSNLAAQWTILDVQLARCGHAAGHDFTLADIALGVHVHRWFSFAAERPALPHLRAWYDQLRTRPAYATHCALPMT